MSTTRFVLSTVATVLVILAFAGSTYVTPRPVAAPTDATDALVAELIAEPLTLAALDFCTSPDSYSIDPPQGPIYCPEPCALDYNCVEACRSVYRDTMLIALRTAYTSCAANEARWNSRMTECRNEHWASIQDCHDTINQTGPALTACLAAATATATDCYGYANAARENGRVTITKTFEEAQRVASEAYWACVSECCDCEK